jgi:hypothetical protein
MGCKVWMFWIPSSNSCLVTADFCIDHSTFVPFILLCLSSGSFLPLLVPQPVLLGAYSLRPWRRNPYFKGFLKLNIVSELLVLSVCPDQLTAPIPTAGSVRWGQIIVAPTRSVSNHGGNSSIFISVQATILETRKHHTMSRKGRWYAQALSYHCANANSLLAHWTGARPFNFLDWLSSLDKLLWLVVYFMSRPLPSFCGIM